MTTPDSGGPQDPLDTDPQDLPHLRDLIAAAERDPDQLLARAERLRAERDHLRACFHSSLRAEQLWLAERNAAEARADELRRAVSRLWMRCYLLAGLAVVGWATVAGLLLSF